MKYVLQKLSQIESTITNTELANHEIQLAGLDDIDAAENAPRQFMDKAIASKKEALDKFMR
jgi:hypothetical protein